MQVRSLSAASKYGRLVKLATTPALEAGAERLDGFESLIAHHDRTVNARGAHSGRKPEGTEGCGLRVVRRPPERFPVPVLLTGWAGHWLRSRRFRQAACKAVPFWGVVRLRPTPTMDAKHSGSVRSADNREVGGSTPPASTKLGPVATLVRAAAF